MLDARLGTATRGRINESHFANDVLARQDTAPKATHVHLVPSAAPPAGVGESGVPVIAPAIANALSRRPVSGYASCPWNNTAAS